MTKNYLATLLFSAIALTACGGDGGSSDTPKKSDDTTSSIKKYKIVATPTSGGNCRGANGTMVIKLNKLASPKVAKYFKPNSNFIGSNFLFDEIEPTEFELI